jgi:MarR family transcriptional regulator, 2-MHQ and catechol-resistance regulon repressor
MKDVKDSAPLKGDLKTKSDTSALHVWLILWKAARAVEQNALSSVSRLGLGLSDFAVLEVLLHKGAQPVNEIGRKVLLTSGSITTAIDRLESRKLVDRTRHPEDRRARLVQLTGKGERLIRCAFEQHALDMEQTMAVLTSSERQELIQILKKVGIFAAARLARLDRLDTEPTPEPRGARSSKAR